MAPDDDIAGQLPEPPPPAPLRRQAAIEQGLRRFDAAHGARPLTEALPAPAPREHWWTRIGRPQAAALVTVGLVALFGVPAAWLSVSQKSAPLSHEKLASAGSVVAGQAVPPPLVSAAAADSAAAPPPAVAPASLPPAKTEQPPAESSTLLASEEAKDKDARVLPQAIAVSAAPSEPVRVEAVPAETRAPTMHAKQGYASRADKLVRLADAASPGRPVPMVAPAAAPPPPAPPPPPPMMVASTDTAATTPFNYTAAARKQAARESEADDGILAGRARGADNLQADSIIAAGQRRSARKSAGRGDWNACTINDPARSLQKCGGQVNAAAPGPNGRAAAHVADGLMRAWQGDLDGAISDFDRAIATAPRYAVAYLNRGLALQRKGEFSRAAADLDRAVRYAPSSARGYYSRGQLLRQRGEADRAEADEDRAVALDPDYVAVVK